MTDREKEIVASFRPWVKAFKRDDAEGMRIAGEAWYSTDPFYPHNQAWTEAEEEQLRAAFAAGILNPYIYGRSENAVKKKRWHMGLTRGAE
tara:strand:+ start:4593 stop:4865 length:273 start_codon:yes stop_codon:yes gene_type:complete